MQSPGHLLVLSPSLFARCPRPHVHAPFGQSASLSSPASVCTWHSAAPVLPRTQALGAGHRVELCQCPPSSWSPYSALTGLLLPIFSRHFSPNALPFLSWPVLLFQGLSFCLPFDPRPQGCAAPAVPHCRGRPSPSWELSSSLGHDFSRMRHEVGPLSLSCCYWRVPHCPQPLIVVLGFGEKRCLDPTLFTLSAPVVWKVYCPLDLNVILLVYRTQ